MMKPCIIVLASLVLWQGCARLGRGDVTFEWFNLTTNEVWVTEATSLPPEACPGRLMPSHAEVQLEVKASEFLDAVKIGDRIKIEWKDNGIQGWPGGLAVPGSVPPGTAHKLELRRTDLGVPAKLNSGRVRFTYLGTNVWRVRMITGSGWEQ